MNDLFAKLAWAPAQSATKNFVERMAQTARLMVGVPDYESYVAHVRERHPDIEPMSYNDFFKERQSARYGGRLGRCC